MIPSYIESFKPAPSDPIADKIEAAMDAGLDITAAIDALDALEPDSDFEPEETDGEGITESFRTVCLCEHPRINIA